MTKIKRFGGYSNYHKMIQGRKRMEKESLNLSQVISHSDGLPIYFLTGKRYLYQTLFCIQSLTKVTKTKFRFILVDDGSFDVAILNQINHQIRGAEIITQSMIEQNLKNSLPLHLYPYIHHKRKVYPHIKKLTDIHTIPGSNWKLVLDSDMLFWNEPEILINWLKHPNKPLYMQDCQEAYGYSHQFVEKVCGNKITPLINVGIIGLNSELINWAKVDSWIYQLEKQEGASYYLEQALTAMLISNTKANILNRDEYVVNPNKQMIINKSGILHHYVDLSKEGYFKKAWRTI